MKANPGSPVLSLILCSRNDRYMGDSRWRLQTALNYVAKQVDELGRNGDVEVIVADWGSQVPLREILCLSPAAGRIVSFLVIPPEIARELQQDSPFPEVLALNTVARRANGQYIGRIDQDTLVGKRFLATFFELHEGRRQLEAPLPSVLLFANQRRVPYRFAVRCPPFWAVDRFIGRFGRRLWIEVSPRRPFYAFSVGIWLAHRNLWHECGGYDERMIYMNSQEINMINRLMRKYAMVDLGKLIDYDFYHLEHYHSLELRRSSRYRKVNPDLQFLNPDRMDPNGADWGLIRHSLEILPFNGKIGKAVGLKPLFEVPGVVLLASVAGAQFVWDSLILASLGAEGYALWSRRAGIAWETVRGESVIRWPRLLMTLWKQRKARS